MAGTDTRLLHASAGEFRCRLPTVVTRSAGLGGGGPRGRWACARLPLHRCPRGWEPGFVDFPVPRVPPSGGRRPFGPRYRISPADALWAACTGRAAVPPRV